VNKLEENKRIKAIILGYNRIVKGIDADARDPIVQRAYGGIVRAGKGGLVESIAKQLVEIAWLRLDRPIDQLRINPKPRAVELLLKRSYLKKVSDKIRNFIFKNIKQYKYLIKTDVHVYNGSNFVLAIECKAYAENAMIKRILVDFTFLKKTFPKLHCVLLQLESQLGGDYSKTNNGYGSPSTRTLLSYFDLDLHVQTLLQGERRIDQPIHGPGFFKPLIEERLYETVDLFEKLLK